MIVKDLLDVFGNVDVAIHRPVHWVDTDDYTFCCLYSGVASKTPDMVLKLTVESAEPTSQGLNIDVEEMIVGEVGD